MNRLKDTSLPTEPYYEKKDVVDTSENDGKRDVSEMNLKYVRENIGTIFDISVTINETEIKGIYLVSYGALGFEFKTSLTDLNKFKTFMKALENVHCFKKGDGLDIGKYVIDEKYEYVDKVEVVNNKMSDTSSILIFTKWEKADKGEFDRSLYEFIYCGFDGISERFGINKNVLHASTEDIYQLYEKHVGKTRINNIKSEALIYASILESIERSSDGSYQHMFINVDCSPDIEMKIPYKEIFSFNSFYQVNVINEASFGGLWYIARSSEDWLLGPREDKTDKNKEKGKDKQEINLSKVFGLEKIKKELETIGKSLQYIYDNPDKEIEMTRGILMVGNPGTGKTFITEAFCNQFGFKLVRFLDYNDGSKKTMDASSVLNIFEAAKMYAQSGPTVVFIDEIDKIIKANTDEILPVLLNVLSRRNNLLVIGACNTTGYLPDPLLRPGRFDKKLYFGNLSKEAKINIFANLLDDKGVNRKDIDIEAVVESLPQDTPPATMDSIAKQLRISEAVMNDKIDTNKAIDIAEVINDGLSEVVKPRKEDLKRFALHEAAHAVVAVTTGIKVTCATIKTSYNYGGYVRLRYDEDKNLDYDDYERHILVMLAGWSIEKKVYGSPSVGAYSDLHSVEDMLNAILQSGGMGVDSIVIDSRDILNASEKKKKLVFNRSKKKLRSYFKKTNKLLKEHMGLVIKIQQKLIEKERLSGNDIDNIYREYLRK